jgi:hypothetical protein
MLITPPPFFLNGESSECHKTTGVRGSKIHKNWDLSTIFLLQLIVFIHSCFSQYKYKYNI